MSATREAGFVFLATLGFFVTFTVIYASILLAIWNPWKK